MYMLCLLSGVQSLSLNVQPLPCSKHKNHKKKWKCGTYRCLSRMTHDRRVDSIWEHVWNIFVESLLQDVYRCKKHMSPGISFVHDSWSMTRIEGASPYMYILNLLTCNLRLWVVDLTFSCIPPCSLVTEVVRLAKLRHSTCTRRLLIRTDHGCSGNIHH